MQRESKFAIVVGRICSEPTLRRQFLWLRAQREGRCRNRARSRRRRSDAEQPHGRVAGGVRRARQSDGNTGGAASSFRSNAGRALGTVLRLRLALLSRSEPPRRKWSGRGRQVQNRFQSILGLYPERRVRVPASKGTPRHRCRQSQSLRSQGRRPGGRGRRPHDGAGAARELSRGKIWQFRLAVPDKRRPVLIVSRNALLERLQTATVVAITSTRRGSPTEVELGVDEGLKQPSCANLTNLFTVRQSDLKRYVGAVGAEKMRHVCRGLVIACRCD
jgi:mRNA interferase MazF